MFSKHTQKTKCFIPTTSQLHQLIKKLSKFCFKWHGVIAVIHHCSWWSLILENATPTRAGSFTSGNRVSKRCAACFLRTHTHTYTYQCTDFYRLLWKEAQTWSSGIRHRRQTRTLAFSKAKFLPECLLTDINGYLARWFHVRFCVKCMLHSCYWLFLYTCRTHQLFYEW